MAFTGFTKAAIEFLKDLAANNNKEWFENNRSIYETHLLEPLKQLSTDLGIVINSIDPRIETAPKINITVSKIYRDTRFSNDKSPFRVDQWLTFKRSKKQWGNFPEFYFYFTPEEYQYGMGFYAATPENMGCIREHIERFPQRFKKIIETYSNPNCLKLVGKNYRKPIANGLPEEFQPWYQKKNIAVSCTKKIEQGFFAKNLGQVLADSCKFNAEFYHFITESINI